MENKFLNTKYSLINGFYYMLQCALLGYATVFLLDKGIGNSKIGIILSVSSIIGIIFQSFIASFLDKTDKIDEKILISLVLVIVTIFSLIIAFTKSYSITLVGITILTYALSSMLAPFINALTFVFEKRGININYGIARGLGSAGYAIMSLLLGYFVNRFSPSLLPYFYAGLSLITLFIVSRITMPKKEVSKELEVKENISIKEFLKKYKSLNLVFIGTIFLIFDQTLINTYFVQVVTNVGGDLEKMGAALFLQAMVELPTMLIFTKLQKKFSNKNLIIVSAIFFSVKHVLTYLAGSMGMIYVAMSTQILSNALFAPASVYYVGRKVEEKDLNKGQALIAASMTIGNIFAALSGGVLFDLFSVSKVLLFGAVISIIGTVIMVVSMIKDKN